MIEFISIRSINYANPYIWNWNKPISSQWSFQSVSVSIENKQRMKWCERRKSAIYVICCTFLTFILNSSNIMFIWLFVHSFISLSDDVQIIVFKEHNVWFKGRFFSLFSFDVFFVNNFLCSWWKAIFCCCKWGVCALTHEVARWWLRYHH